MQTELPEQPIAGCYWGFVIPRTHGENRINDIWGDGPEKLTYIIAFEAKIEGEPVYAGYLRTCYSMSEEEAKCLVLSPYITLCKPMWSALDFAYILSNKTTHGELIEPLCRTLYTGAWRYKRKWSDVVTIDYVRWHKKNKATKRPIFQGTVVQEDFI